MKRVLKLASMFIFIFTLLFNIIVNSTFYNQKNVSTVFNSYKLNIIDDNYIFSDIQSNNFIKFEHYKTNSSSLKGIEKTFYLSTLLSSDTHLNRKWLIWKDLHYYVFFDKINKIYQVNLYWGGLHTSIINTDKNHIKKIIQLIKPLYIQLLKKKNISYLEISNEISEDEWLLFNNWYTDEWCSLEIDMCIIWDNDRNYFSLYKNISNYKQIITHNEKAIFSVFLVNWKKTVFIYYDENNKIGKYMNYTIRLSNSNDNSLNEDELKIILDILGKLKVNTSVNTEKLVNTSIILINNLIKEINE